MIISSSFRKLDVFFHHSLLWKQSGNHVIDMNADQKQFTNRQLLAGWCFKVLLAIFSVSSSHIYLNIIKQWGKMLKAKAFQDKCWCWHKNIPVCVFLHKAYCSFMFLKSNAVLWVLWGSLHTSSHINFSCVTECQMVYCRESVDFYSKNDQSKNKSAAKPS